MNPSTGSGSDGDDLEQRLASLRPAELPLELQARITRAELTSAKPHHKVRWLYLAAPLAAAAVWLFVFLRKDPPTPREPQPSDFRVFLPIEETSTLVAAEDIAFIDTDPARPVRLVRTTWLDDITYRGDDGRTLRRQEPRVEFIPVVLNAF